MFTLNRSGSLQAAEIKVVNGEAEFENGGWTVRSKQAAFLLAAPATEDYRLDAVMELSALDERKPMHARCLISLLPANQETGPGTDLKSAAYLTLDRDAEGRELTARIHRANPETGRWSWKRGNAVAKYVYQLGEKSRRQRQDMETNAENRWIGKLIHLRLEVVAGQVSFWIDGLFTAGAKITAAAAGAMTIQLAAGDRLHGVRISPVPAENAGFIVLDLENSANAAGLKPAVSGDGTAIGGIPFKIPGGARDHLCLRAAGWIDQLQDPPRFIADYDSGAPSLADERMPMLRVPRQDYTAAHLLAVADNAPETVPRFTLRAGIYGGRNQVVQHDFLAEVPLAGSQGAVLETEDGRGLYHVRLPLSLVFAQDIDSDWLDLELTREVRLAVRRPDPNRFQRRPLGLPSGVRIAAITLERSPLQMQVTSSETGHAFQEPQIPAFQVKLTNITGAEFAFRLEATATPLRSEPVTAHQSGIIPAGAEAGIELPLPIGRGYADVEIRLLDGAGELLLVRRTSMTLLPPAARRQYRHLSPFGTWDFGGAHFTNDDPDLLGPLYLKLGLRFGMAAFPPAVLERYGIFYNNEANVHFGLEHPRGMKRRQSQGDRALPFAQVFHETSISGPHSSRVPDLFHDRPAYQFNEAEKKRFAEMWEQATTMVDQAREAYPGLHLRFGNGPIAVREEFYRHKLPPDKFDSGGNESATFGRMPEAQPPDIVALNASIWMDRQLLDHYGYKDKPVTLNFEVIYPSTNPGNLDERTQADYMVRHALHSLAWGMEHIRPGAISDVGNSYYSGNWGSSGFTRAKPEFSVKPAFTAFAAMTLVLDGAKFIRLHDTGSFSAYALEFKRPDEAQVFAMWSVRGQRQATLRFDQAPVSVTLVDDQSRETALEITKNSVQVMLSSSPVYAVVRGGRFAEFTLGNPDHADAEPAAGTAVAEIANLGVTAGWLTRAEANHMLEHYNDKTAPRRRGDFVFEPVAEFAGVENALRVTPRPLTSGKDTMPMYMERLHAEGFELPGRPTHLAVRVHGNSGWGRVIFSLTDASGQVWTQVGAAQTGEISPWLLDWMPAELVDSVKLTGLEDWNTNDIFGDSRINFDGWRLVSVPLPGQYPGESGRQYHWPRTSQWHYTGDGLVHYPLKLTRIIVELNEKILHINRYEPPAKPEIYLGQVFAIDAGQPEPRNANQNLTRRQ